MRLDRLTAPLAACAVLWSTPAAAQTRFAWPDTAVDVAAYTNVEDCQAAVVRALDHAEATRMVTTGFWRDTVMLDTVRAVAEAKQRLAPAAVQTARRCGARFANPDSVPLERYRLFLSLYLRAEWDDKARQLIERQLAAVRPKTDAERVTVLDTTFKILIGNNERIGPKRSALGMDVGLAHIATVSDRLRRLRLYVDLFSFLPTRNPPREEVLRITERLLPLVDSLDQKEFDRLASQFTVVGEGVEDAQGLVERFVAVLNMAMGREAFLDSLRRSTDAYVNAVRGNWARATGMRPESYQLGQNPVGAKAPPLAADIWIGHDRSAGPRPTPGRVSLVAFVPTSRCLGAAVQEEWLNGSCARYLVALRELEKRFPELEVTVAAQTSGHFAYMKEGLTPEQEARQVKRWIESFGVQAPVAMTSTPFVRLPGADARRLNPPSEDRVAYGFGNGPVKELDVQALLLDENGVVIHQRSMNRYAIYEDFNDLIQVLLERQRQPTELIP